jgi:hypothetical protein
MLKEGSGQGQLGFSEQPIKNDEMKMGIVCGFANMNWSRTLSQRCSRNRSGQKHSGTIRNNTFQRHGRKPFNQKQLESLDFNRLQQARKIWFGAMVSNRINLRKINRLQAGGY